MSAWITFWSTPARRRRAPRAWGWGPNDSGCDQSLLLYSSPRESTLNHHRCDRPRVRSGPLAAQARAPRRRDSGVAIDTGSLIHDNNPALLSDHQTAAYAE